MQYIIRYKSTQRGRATRFWTVPADTLEVRFKETHRRVGHLKGLGPVVESTGHDRSTITMRARLAAGSKDERGKETTLPWTTTRLIESNQVIRVLTPEAEEVLAAYDREIAEKLRELKSIRDTRRVAMDEVWRRAEKVQLHELEEKADA